MLNCSNGEPTQGLVREVPKPLVLPGFPFAGEAGGERGGGTACSVLRDTEMLPEKEKMEALRLLQVTCSGYTGVSPAPCFWVAH